MVKTRGKGKTASRTAAEAEASYLALTPQAMQKIHELEGQMQQHAQNGVRGRAGARPAARAA